MIVEQVHVGLAALIEVFGLKRGTAKGERRQLFFKVGRMIQMQATASHEVDARLVEA